MVPNVDAELEGRTPEMEEDSPTPQFQLVLLTDADQFVIAASDTVNDMVEQAKIWLQSSTAGQQLVDSQVRSIILQEVDPATGDYVDGEEIPVADKADVVTQARNLGAR
jgi:hypothetical protein